MILLDASALLKPDLGLVFWTFVVFLILWIILGRFAFRPIASALRKREDTIEEALQSAEMARAEMEKLHADNEKLLQEAREERSKILKEAKEAKDSIINEAREQAKVEASKIAESNRKDIENQKQAAMAELKDLAASLALAVAEKVVRRELKEDKSQQAYVKQLVDEVKLN